MVIFLCGIIVLCEKMGFRQQIITKRRISLCRDREKLKTSQGVTQLFNPLLLIQTE